MRRPLEEVWFWGKRCLIWRLRKAQVLRSGVAHVVGSWEQAIVEGGKSSTNKRHEVGHILRG